MKLQYTIENNKLCTGRFTWWNFGSLLRFCPVIHITAGLSLAVHYCLSIDVAFPRATRNFRRVGMAQSVLWRGYGLDGRGSIPCRGHSVQTRPGSHQASYPMVTVGSFPRGKIAGAETNHSPPCSAKVKNGGSIMLRLALKTLSFCVLNWLIRRVYPLSLPSSWSDA
jgi:hypothetical protein